MLREQSPQQLTTAAGIFESLDYHLAVPAALRGAVPASLWVDDPAAPRAGLMKIGHRYYLAGDPGIEPFLAGLSRFFAETVYPPIEARGGWGFLLYYSDPAWETPLREAVLPGRKLFLNPREYYRLDEDQFPEPGAWKARLPQGFEPVPADRALLENETLTNRDVLIEEMGSERASVDEFLAHSFGTCLIRGDRIVTWCLSEYNLDRRCEVGIATDEVLRGRGLATLTGLAFIDQARAAGITSIGWHCWKKNAASGATARKLGFQKVLEYPSFFCSAQ